MQCLILAGGIATRMRPLTENLPKALIPILGVPFIDYQLRWLKLNDIEEVTISIGFLGQMIRGYVGDGDKWGLKVSYVDEGNAKLGTGGAIALSMQKSTLGNRFFLLWGDSFLPISFLEVWREAEKDRHSMLMTVFLNNNKFDRSNVHFQNGRVLLYDKSGKGSVLHPFDYIDYGLMVLDRKVLEEDFSSAKIPEKFDIAETMNRVSLAGKLAGFQVTERFYEVGSPEGLADFERWLEGNYMRFK